ncbi:hypothetical protein [Anoxybacteroides tepidamans]|uniref:hypothetical protein n=1 Tax=Anoxybacteroides tepidamans TaxID=265948 RepID=UPI000482D4AB|nr:hypothetical protein [Anoxybacillus tepidamans]
MLDRIMFQVILLGTGFLLDAIGLRSMAAAFDVISLLFIIYFFVKESKQHAAFQQHDRSL